MTPLTRAEVERIRDQAAPRGGFVRDLADTALALMDDVDDYEREREEDKGFTNAIAQGNTAAMRHALGPETFNRFWGPDLERLGRVMDTITVERDAALRASVAAEQERDALRAALDRANALLMQMHGEHAAFECEGIKNVVALCQEARAKAAPKACSQCGYETHVLFTCALSASQVEGGTPEHTTTPRGGATCYVCGRFIKEGDTSIAYDGGAVWSHFACAPTSPPAEPPR